MSTLPFHLSICVNDLEESRHFYTKIIGLEERRLNKSSAHFNFYGTQLTCHHFPGYNAKNFQVEVDAEDVPVPHFGVALDLEEFQKVKERLISLPSDKLRKQFPPIDRTWSSSLIDDFKSFVCRFRMR